MQPFKREKFINPHVCFMLIKFVFPVQNDHPIMADYKSKLALPPLMHLHCRFPGLLVHE